MKKNSHKSLNRNFFKVRFCPENNNSKEARNKMPADFL